MPRQTKEKRNKQNRNQSSLSPRPQQGEPKETTLPAGPARLLPCVTRASLLVQTVLSLLRKLSSGSDAPYPGALQENQNRLRGLLPKPLGPQMFPPMRLPDFLPQFPDLGQPGPAHREKVVASLLLSSPAPPTHIIRRPANLVLQVGADGDMPGQQLVIWLWRPPEESASEPSSRGVGIFSGGFQGDLRSSERPFGIGPRWPPASCATGWSPICTHPGHHYWAVLLRLRPLRTRWSSHCRGPPDRPGPTEWKPRYSLT